MGSNATTKRDSAPIRSALALVCGGTILRLAGESVVIGRATDCALQISDPRVSGHHAEIYALSGGWWVRDLGSTNGTYVDDDIVEAAPIEVGSRLRLGTDGPVVGLVPLAESA